MFPKLILSTTKLVESLYGIVIPVLTTAKPVQHMQRIVTQLLTTAKPFECMWRMVLQVWTTAGSVNGLQMFGKYILTVAKAV